MEFRQTATENGYEKSADTIEVFSKKKNDQGTGSACRDSGIDGMFFSGSSAQMSYE